MSEIDTHRNTARAARDEWRKQMSLWHNELLFNAIAAAIVELSERVFRVYEASLAGNEGRSTPIYIADGATAVDFRNKEWQYSEPADVWYRIPKHTPDFSAISWPRLNYVHGPLELKDE